MAPSIPSKINSKIPILHATTLLSFIAEMRLNNAERSSGISSTD